MTTGSRATGIFAGLRRALAVGALALATGCASVPNADPRDPLEGFNRAVYSFNEGFDDAIARPVASAYKSTLPDPVRGWVRNFFANIADLFIGLNNLLQGKPGHAASDWARVVFNTTIGLFGINDVATDLGFEKHDEDFGQTFGRWGAADGAYLVWPILGSSTVRDTVGRVLDMSVDPVRRHRPTDARNAAVLLRGTGQRADLLDASRMLEEAALDKYVFQRDAYLQRRRNQIYDGRPPREPAAQAAPVQSAHTPAQQGPAPAEPPAETPATPAAAAVRGVFEPRVPANYDAVLAATPGRRHARADR